jgi:hypothetical protein
METRVRREAEIAKAISAITKARRWEKQTVTIGTMTLQRWRRSA